MKRRFWIRPLAFVAGIWLVVNAIVGIGILEVLISKSEGILRAFHRILQLASIWGIIAGFLLLFRKELGRRMTTLYCWANLILALVSIAIRGARWVYFGSTMASHPELNIVPNQWLREVMANIYIVAILIFLTRPSVVNLFQGSSKERAVPET